MLSSTQLHNLETKRFYCELCNTNKKDKYGLDKHLKTNKHQKKSQLNELELMEKEDKKKHYIAKDNNVNYTKNSIISRTADLQIQIAQLNAKRISLSETNKKIFLYGENSDDFIFALNRLPNNFQR